MLLSLLLIVLPAVLYGYETWTFMKAHKSKPDSSELWKWRRLLKIPQTARRTNASEINLIKPTQSLETLAIKRKLKYFRHIMQTSDSVDKDLMFGLTDGSGRRQRQQIRWRDEI
jgi:hypothetical protein